MKMVSSSEEGDAELVEQAMTVIHDNIEGKLDQSTYIRAYSSLQDDVRNANYVVFPISFNWLYFSYYSLSIKVVICRWEWRRTCIRWR